MMLRKLTLASLVLAMFAAAPAFAEQSLPSDQQQKVESKLKQDGYSKWDEIGMADGVIKVDNAVDASGKKFDLQLDPKSMDVTKKTAE